VIKCIQFVFDFMLTNMSTCSHHVLSSLLQQLFVVFSVYVRSYVCLCLLFPFIIVLDVI
jgi:hypothetical protein